MDKAPSPHLKELLKVIAEIEQGVYSDGIMSLTGKDTPEPIRSIAEAMAAMMVRVEAREYHLEQLNQELKGNVVKTVLAMAQALGARDPHTYGHDQRVAEYAARLAERAGLPPEEVEHVHRAGLLHDLGKIGFSDALLKNEDIEPGEEFLGEIQAHPHTASDILEGLDFLGPALDYVRFHHERMDGSGHPYGLRGEDIPYGARIVAVADVFDAMVTDRPYQKGRPPEEVLAVMRRLAGKLLDPDLVETFAGLIQAPKKD